MKNSVAGSRSASGRHVHLWRFADNADGYMDEVHDCRDRFPGRRCAIRMVDDADGCGQANRVAPMKMSLCRRATGQAARLRVWPNPDVLIGGATTGSVGHDNALDCRQRLRVAAFNAWFDASMT